MSSEELQKGLSHVDELQENSATEDTITKTRWHEQLTSDSHEFCNCFYLPPSHTYTDRIVCKDIL